MDKLLEERIKVCIDQWQIKEDRKDLQDKDALIPEYFLGLASVQNELALAQYGVDVAGEYLFQLYRRDMKFKNKIERYKAKESILNLPRRDR